jgi:hypothetical protein
MHRQMSWTLQPWCFSLPVVTDIPKGIGWLDHPDIFVGHLEKNWLNILWLLSPLLAWRFLEGSTCYSPCNIMMMMIGISTCHGARCNILPKTMCALPLLQMWDLSTWSDVPQTQWFRREIGAQVWDILMLMGFQFGFPKLKAVSWNIYIQTNTYAGYR